jgi:hypothetical protein
MGKYCPLLLLVTDTVDMGHFFHYKNREDTVDMGSTYSTPTQDREENMRTRRGVKLPINFATLFCQTYTAGFTLVWGWGMCMGLSKPNVTRNRSATDAPNYSCSWRGTSKSGFGTKLEIGCPARSSVSYCHVLSSYCAFSVTRSDH